MSKKIGMYLYSELQNSNKNEQNAITHFHMDEPQKYI